MPGRALGEWRERTRGVRADRLVQRLHLGRCGGRRRRRRATCSGSGPRTTSGRTEHPAEFGVRAELREEGTSVDVVVRANAIQRGDHAVAVIFGRQAAQKCDAVNACASGQGELVRLGVLKYLVRVLLGDGPRRESADADPCSDAANVVGELTCGVC